MQTSRVDSEKAKCSCDGEKDDEDGGESSTIWIICGDLPHCVENVKTEKGGRIGMKEMDVQGSTMLLLKQSTANHDQGIGSRACRDRSGGHYSTAPLSLNLVVTHQEDGDNGKDAEGLHADG